MTTDDIVNAEPSSRTLTIDLNTGRWLAGGPMQSGDGERIAATVLPGITPEMVAEWYGRWMSDDPEGSRDVYRAIQLAREAAHAKHGADSIEGQPADSPRWLAILTEEVGEVAHELTYDATGGDILHELIQTAAVASAWAESIMRERARREDEHPTAKVLDDFTRRRQEREGFTVRDGGSTSRGVFFDPRPADADCDLPPAGWLCTKVAGHDGPCPTIPAPDRA